jgi:ankyrin repeat protein
MSFADIKKAIKTDKIKAVKKLVEADPAIVNITNSDGDSPLYIAVQEENMDIAKYLIDNGADVNHINTREVWSILHLACHLKNLEMVELLIDNGANLEEKNEQGQTALIIAIQKNHGKSHLEVIETLLKAGADFLYTDNTGRTALDWAQQNDDDDVIRLLIQYAPSTSNISSSSSNSSSRSTSSRSKSKSFSVGSVEPTALDIVTIKQSKLPDTAEDFINIEDVNIVDFLAESDKNRIIKVHNSFYALNGEDVKSHFLSKAEKNHYVYYPCKRALPPPALGVSKDDVHMDKPLFSASYLVGVLSDFVLLSEVMAMLDSEHKYFEIMANSEVQHVPATASAQMFTSNRNAVSANHCQEGKEAKILKLKRLDIVDEDASSAEAEGRKRRTRRNKGNKRTMKRKQNQRRKTTNRRTKTRISKRRQ